MYLFLSPLLLGAIVLGLGGIIVVVLHVWATDGEQPFISFMIALLGEIAWLGLIILVCGNAA